jgi:hypothetical protein
MYQTPVLFPEISNREAWLQIIQVYDDDTGDLITLVDGNGNASYSVTLEIRPPRRHGSYGSISGSPYYDCASGEPIIFSQLVQGASALNPGGYISIVDSGTINIQIPKSIMQTLRRTETYDVFLTLDDPANDDGRQLLIGKLPVLFGGRAT